MRRQAEIRPVSAVRAQPAPRPAAQPERPAPATPRPVAPRGEVVQGLAETLLTFLDRGEVDWEHEPTLQVLRRLVVGIEAGLAVEATA